MESFLEVGQGPSLGCSAKGKKLSYGRRWDSSVCIAMGYGLEGLGSIAGMADFSLLHSA
jgi:hypothetical protein